jgi:opacity protein-like surface antigen
MKIKHQSILLATLCVALFQTAAVCRSDTAGSLALPKAEGINYSLSLGGIYEQVGSANDAYGALMNFAMRFGRNHKAAVDFGMYGYTQKMDAGWARTDDAKWTTVPVWLSYNYCFLFGANDRFEVHVGPTAGVEWVKAEGTTEVTYPIGTSYDVNDSEFGYSYGAVGGLTWHFSKKFFLDASVRYMRGKSFDSKISGTGTRKNATVSIGFKF